MPNDISSGWRPAHVEQKEVSVDEALAELRAASRIAKAKLDEYDTCECEACLTVDDEFECIVGLELDIVNARAAEAAHAYFFELDAKVAP